MALLRQIWRERKIGLILLLFIGYVKFHYKSSVEEKTTFDQVVSEVKDLSRDELEKLSKIANRRIRALLIDDDFALSGDGGEVSDGEVSELIADFAISNDDDSEDNSSTETSNLNQKILLELPSKTTEQVLMETQPTVTNKVSLTNATMATNTTMTTNATTTIATTKSTVNRAVKFIKLDPIEPLKAALEAKAKAKPSVMRIMKPNTYINATHLNVYVFYKPEHYDRRRIFRKYVQMWREINPPEMIPFDYWLVTASTEATQTESKNSGDMLLFDGFDKIHFGTDQEGWEYEWRMMLGVLEHAGSTDTQFGHVTLTTRGTDIINFEWIKKCTAQLSADDPKLNTTQIISIDPMRRDLKHKKNVADLKMIFRSDLIPFWLKKLVTIDFNQPDLVKPFEKFFAISGIGRPTEINRIQSNGINEAIITIPWEYEGFAERYNASTFEAWTMEKKPSTQMSYNLPARYLEEREDPWETKLVSTPSCNTTGILAIVKTARSNFVNRLLIRKYYEWSKPTSVGPVLLRFVIGTGSESEDPVLSQNMTDEINNYGDIIEGDFVDKYDNLPLKTLTGHQ